VLIGIDDVAPGVGEEAADGGDQARPVGTGEEQARGGGAVVDLGMIPTPVPLPTFTSL
jgi:hypothetical protein